MMEKSESSKNCSDLVIGTKKKFTNLIFKFWAKNLLTAELLCNIQGIISMGMSSGSFLHM